MKLRAPHGCASICHDGKIFIVEADGGIEVSKAMAAPLAAHGFTPWEEKSEGASPELAAGTADDIDALNRRELFAFLRERGVRVRLPITNDALRAAARAALREPEAG
jgi:hypothetical protein